MSQYLSKLASKCQGIAGVISDGEKVQTECPDNLKSVLLEASHALDNEAVTVKNGRLHNARGASRKMTLRERLAFWLLGRRAEIRV